VIGDGHRLHAAGQDRREKVLEPDGAVEEAVLGVKVKMREFSHGEDEPPGRRGVADFSKSAGLRRPSDSRRPRTATSRYTARAGAMRLSFLSGAECWRSSRWRLRRRWRSLVLLGVLAACGDNTPQSPAVPAFLGLSPDMQELKPGTVFPFTFLLLAQRPGAPAPEPAPGKIIDVTLEDDPSTADPEPRGATLSAASVMTDAQGQATVQVTAGLQTTFLLRGRLRDAPLEAASVIVVNDNKGATLVVQPDATATTAVDHVVIRLFDDRVCRTLRLNPPSTPVRSPVQVAPGESATFLSVARGSAAQALGYDDAGTLRAVGCVDVPETVLKGGATSTLILPLAARPPSFAPAFDLKTTFTGAAAVAGTLAPWRDLSACRLGPEAAWLDALTTVLRASGAGTLADALGALRGARAGTPSCPADTRAAGGLSLERTLGDAFPAAGPVSSTRAAVATDVLALFDGLFMSSSLAITPTTDAARLDATHTFVSLTFTVRGATATIAGRPLGLPGEVAYDVEVTLQPDGSWLFGTHALAFAWGTLASAALPELVLRPRGLPEDLASWLAAWIAEAPAGTKPADGGAATGGGCAALDPLLCTAAGRSAGCLGGACAAATTRLAQTLGGALAALDGTGNNLSLAGSALASDSNGDGIVDALGSPTAPGLWSLTAATTSGSQAIDATFTGKASAP